MRGRLPRPGPPVGPGTSLLHRLEAALFLLALAGMGVFLAQECGTAVFQRVEGARLDRMIETGRGGKGPQVDRGDGLSAVPGTVLGRIAIPSAGLSAVVVEGCGAAELAHAVGRIPGTAGFGGPGVIGLAGHRDGLFFPLRKVARGDSVIVRTPRSTFTYVVESLRVVIPSRTEVLRGGSSPGLVLVTCYPFRFIGSAPFRFVVRARQVSAA